jgi:hypothetical protein
MFFRYPRPAACAFPGRPRAIEDPGKIVGGVDWLELAVDGHLLQLVDKFSWSISSTAGPLSAVIRDIAWKAQVRLCARYRRLAAAGKPKVVVTTAIAREMVGFIWAIARIAQPALD